MARLTGHELTVRDWEQRWGREGLWCSRCRRTTPPALLVVDGHSAVLACETCSRPVLRDESWLAQVARLVPVQVSPAVEVPGRT